MGEITLDYVPLSEVVLWPANPKLHAKEDICASIEEFGFIDPLVVDERTGMLVAGHGRVETLVAMKSGGRKAPERVRVREADGEWLVPVVRGVRFNSDAEAAACAMADNRLVEVGGWDEDRKADLLVWIKESGGAEALRGTGFTPREVDDLMLDLAGGEAPDPREYDESVADGLVLKCKWTLKYPSSARRDVEAAVAELASSVQGFTAAFEE